MQNILQDKDYFSEQIHANYIKTNGGRELYFNLKHTKKDMNIGDCVMRAVTLATGETYEKVWKDMFTLASEMGFFPNDAYDRVAEKFLSERGFTRIKLSNKKQKVRTNELLDKSPICIKDKWVICHTTKHWVATYNNIFCDSWDSYGRNRFDEHPVVWNMFVQDNTNWQHR